MLNDECVENKLLNSLWYNKYEKIYKSVDHKLYFPPQRHENHYPEIFILYMNFDLYDKTDVSLFIHLCIKNKVLYLYKNLREIFNIDEHKSVKKIFSSIDQLIEKNGKMIEKYTK